MRKILLVILINPVTSNILLAMASLYAVRTLGDAGLKLKTLRLEQNRTQDEVCTAVGLSRRALSALESGSASDVRLQTLLKLLRYFNCQLMVGPESPVPTLDELDFERQRARVSPAPGVFSISGPVPRVRATGSRRSKTAGALETSKSPGGRRTPRTKE
jgi:transcriptional regulator with XRE-family HTH domain